MATATKPKEAKKLTPKQQQFCIEYIIDFNATQAAIRAGYSKKTAKQQGSLLLTNIDIQAKVTELTQERQARAKKSGDDVIAELEHIAFSRTGDVVHWNESGASFIKNSEDISDEAHAAIESIEVTEDMVGSKEDTRMVQKTKVKMHSKVKALEMLAKHHALYPDSKADLNITGPVKIEIVKFGKKSQEDEE
jgi:phage terminase small subunit